MTNVLDPSQLPVRRELPQSRRNADVALLATLGARRRGNRRTLLAVGGVVLVGSVAAGGVVVTRDGEASNRNLVQCHTTLEVGRGDDFPGGSMVLARASTATDPGGPILIDDAIGSCTDVWRQGVIRLNLPRPFGPDGQDHPVPDLVACVNSKGVVAVFPSKSAAVCDSLGLERLVRRTVTP